MNPISYPDGTNRKALVLAIARAKGDALSLRRELEATNSAQLMPIAKATVTAHTVADLPGYATIVDDFAKAMVSNSFLDYVTINNLANVAQLHSRYAIWVSGSAGVGVAEGGMKPIGSMTFGTLDLAESKAVALVVVSNEVLRFSNAATILDRALRAKLGEAKDSIAIPLLIDSSTPSIGSSGSSAANVGEDLATALAEMTLHASSRLVLVVSPATAASLAVKMTGGLLAFPDMTPQGGSIAGIPVFVSAGLPGDTALLVDASQLLVASAPITLDSSNATTVQMNDAPGEGASNATSMFQTNSTAMKAEQHFGVQAMTGNAVVVIEGVDW